YADGCIYIGEGFHKHKGCRVFCIDADTGKLQWKSEPTNSHTESTPVVVGGKVYTGAGDDGVLCLDAKTATKTCQFPDRGDGNPLTMNRLHLHVDATLAVADGKVYGGAGSDEDAKNPEEFGEPAIFCLDAATGKQIWLERTPQWMARKADPTGPKYHLP